MRRRLRTTEELYDDLVEHIQYVFEKVAYEGYTEQSEDLDPGFMLDHILEQSLRFKKQYDSQVEEGQRGLNYNFETIAMLLRGITKSDE